MGRDGLVMLAASAMPSPTVPVTVPAPAPITDLAQARAVFAELQSRARTLGRTLRAPPEEPTSCCERGCNGCVWEGFYAAAGWWQEDALQALAG